jgi:hypothetical protein
MGLCKESFFFSDVDGVLCRNDEMSRGYFADMSEFKKHGGKVLQFYDHESS